MARRVYTRRSGKDHSHKGILWVAMILALVLLLIPVLWMNYPFRRGALRGLHKIPSDKENVRVVVQGKIPREIIDKQSVGKSYESKEGSRQVIVARIGTKEENIKGGGKSQAIQKPRVSVNPYEDEEKAKLARTKQESKFKKAVSAGALKELEQKKQTITAKSENSGGSSKSLETGKKGGLYSLITPAKEELKKGKSGEQAERVIPNAEGRQKKSGGARTPSTTSSTSKMSKKRTSHNVTYWVQVGAFTKKTNAVETSKRLKSLGYSGVIHQVRHAKYGKLYLVRVPTYGNKADARKLVSILSKKLGESPIIIKVKK